MSANQFGTRFKVTTFGESHGPAMGGIIDGCPAGVAFDEALLVRFLSRRRPGQSPATSDRKELDQPRILSGVFEGKTLGTPIAFTIENVDQRPQDYDAVKTEPRPGHADDVWKEKFSHSDHRGGGRSSGRETVSRVAAGAIAQMFCLAQVPRMRVAGLAREIGPLVIPDRLKELTRFHDEQPVTEYFPGERLPQDVVAFLESAKTEGQSYGGVAEVRLMGLPSGLGQPVFHKLKADLAAAMMSVGATIGVEFGKGFLSSREKGSEYHAVPEDNSGTLKNANYGGIRGGISTGEDIVLRVAFKPTSSIMDTAKRGRHDPCIVPRALPVLEAMAWLVLADHLLWQRSDRLYWQGSTGDNSPS